MTDIVVPKLNTNDTSYTLTGWLIPHGDPVSAGDVIAEIETSKAAQELTSTGDGVLHHTIAAGAECRCGDVIGRILAEREPEPRAAAVPAVRGEGPLITEPARARAAELGISDARLRDLGKSVIRSKDVELLAAAAQDTTHTFSRTQRAVAAVVSESHRTIPAAFAAVTVRVEDALAAARHLGRRHSRFVGLPELVVKALAGLRQAHPLMFAARLDEHTAALAPTANVGVTLDLGQGLFIPVVTGAEALTCVEIAEQLAAFKVKALDGTFTTADLRGAAIVLALHNDPDITLAGPIVFPGHSCVVALAGTRQELTLDADGQVRSHKIAAISVVYDHRVVNGRDAVAFLRDLKNALEVPAALTQIGDQAPC
ncbi:2-oxo acid dehydrogenase subunit E2 [Nonomuraea sp. NBC_01738]|uniref:2-oxo acid dehydrogenase subunit E2 n=1 Tax=Nonomuraea sp. NBC_01738 TaxID=2976003 RepID=UPI002E0FE897|nr:2-oxo acid dehydrogenase subunit E2 [Nonomuraea sp. NBC_01738]